jgi:hypothetical protein
MKYAPYGIDESEQIEPYKKIIPERVQKLIDLYRKNKIDYPWDAEDVNEQMFDYRRSLKPSSYTYNLEAIYRVRDPYDKKNEYYFFQKKGRVLNDNDDPEYSNSHTYGFAVEHVHELRWNPKTKRKEPFKIRDDPVYFYKWDKREVAKLLAQSDVPCMNFYIGTASRRGQGGGSPAGDILTVKNKQDFLEGSFDDLIILNKSGLMVTEESTLHLVEKAKKKLEDRAVEKVASQAAAVSNQ